MDTPALSLKGQPTAMITMPTLNKLHKITLDDKILVGPQWSAIQSRIYREMNVDIEDMPERNVWETKRGLWPKRFKTWVYKVFDIRDVDPKLLSDIGGVMGKMSVNQTFYVDFVNEAKWKAGAFGEKCSSCWWSTSYGRARLGLFEKGGIAMRFFSSPRQRSINKGTKGIGRAWLFPTGSDLFLFNSYGFEMSVSARVLASIMGQGWRYDTVPFYMEDAYINGEKAFRFSQSGFDPREYIRLPSITSRYVGYCYHCGEKVKAYDCKEYTEENEAHRIYHPDCADHDLTNCAYCSELSLADQMTHLPHYNESVCHSCISSYYIKCNDCGRHIKRRDINDVHWTHSTLNVCNDCLPKYPRCECNHYFKNRTTLRRHQGSCRTYRRNHRPATTERVTLDQVIHAYQSNSVSVSEYENIRDEYARQEELTLSQVDRLAWNGRPNPTPSVSVADLHRALTDDHTRYDEYIRMLDRYAEQEHITRHEAYRRADRYEAQDLHEQSTPQEPPIYTGWDLLDEMAGVDAQSQGNEAQGLPTPTIMAGQAGTFESAPAVLDGSQPVEPTPPGEGRGAFGWSAMDRLRSAIPNQYAQFYVDWANEPERTTEPIVSVDRGLSEQEMQRIREAIHRNETSAFTGTWVTISDFTGGVDEPGVRGDDPEQNSTTETE
jgi:hypothetical protein